MKDWTAHIIFCDDIRQEMNSKYILIGVYTGEMIAFVSPINISVSTFIEINGLALGGVQLHIKVRFEDGHHTTHVGETYIAMEVLKEDQPTIIAPTGLPFFSDRPGKLIASLAVNGGEPRDIGRLSIAHDPSPRPGPH